MRGNQQPLPPPPTAVPNRQQRRRSDLTLPVPHRDISFAVPLPLPPTSAPSSSAPPPLNFADLQRLNRIGSGTGGTVYRVLHPPTGKTYALKVIYGHHEESVRLQIRREIEILREINNPNVVRCHDMSDHGGEIQVLLEYMDGGSLEHNHIQSEPLLADFARQILTGLHYLHRRKIIHRDIKPANLLINSNNEVKIADFGVSKILDTTIDPCYSSVGTIAYMSPERINSDMNQGRYDGYAGDIWGFGVSILEFYLGRFPFNAQGDWSSLMNAICFKDPPEAPATASREFRDFVACCLQREPARRWSPGGLLRHPFIVQNTAAPPQGHQLLPPPRRQSFP